jgi:hypothetical protein
MSSRNMSTKPLCSSVGMGSTLLPPT